MFALLSTADIERDARPCRAWTSSDGWHFSFSVTLLVTAQAIGHASRYPAVMDTVIAVLAAAAAQDPGCALERVQLKWGRFARDAVGYRDVGARSLHLSDERELREEAVAFLRASEASAAVLDVAQHASLRFDGTTLTLSGVDRRSVRECEAALAPLAARVVCER